MDVKHSPHIFKEDNVLFLLIKKRDKEAFTVVYRKYHAYVYAIALKYLKNVEMAEETVQQIFVKLWETSAKIEIEINLKNYLYTMTKNHILNLFRDNREAISLNYLHAQALQHAESDFIERLEEKELHELLHSGIEKLPPQKREVCRLKLEAKYNNREIAEIMNISVHTVKSHYQESIKLLREYLKNID